MISSQPVDFNSLSDSNKHSVIIGSCGLIDRFVYRICLFSSLEIRASVMVSVLASCAVDRGFESRLGQTKDYKICICCFSTKHAALRRKSTYWLAWNQCLSEATCLSG